MQREKTELEAMLAALNRSAERMQALWLSFIGLSIYFILTALTTTHRTLLLEDPQTLPLVNLKVPLLPFYIIAPLFYLAIHFYILLMLVLLARSAAAFETMLRESMPIDSDRERFRMRLENALFLQLLSGAYSERRGINGRFLAAMALITIAMTPIATLLVMQLQFLPYHSLVITWLHRATILTDLMLVWLLWRGYRHRWGQTLPRSPRALWRQRGPYWWLHGPMALTGRFLALFVVFWMSLAEGRWAGEPWIDPHADRDYAGAIGIHLPNSENGFRRKTFSLEDATISSQSPSYGPDLPASGANPISAWKSKFIEDGFRPLFWLGLFADRLSLRNETIVGSARLEETRREARSETNSNRFLATRTFGGRDFTRADFTEADLRSVDFRSIEADGRGQARTTILRQANLSGALLDEARFDGADMTAAELRSAHANGASFDKANLFSADLRNARLNGASLKNTNLVCAEMTKAEARAVDFSSSWMTAAVFQGTDLSGASFASVRMPLSRLYFAKLDGTKIIDSEIHGAKFGGFSSIATRLSLNFAFGIKFEKPLFLENAIGLLFNPFLPQIARIVRDSLLPSQNDYLIENYILNNNVLITAKKSKLHNENDLSLLEILANNSTKELLIDIHYYNSWFYLPIKNNYTRCYHSQDVRVRDFDRFVKEASSSGTFLTDLEKETKANDPKGEKYQNALAGVIGDLACRGGEGAPYVARALIRNRFDELAIHLNTVRDRLKAGRTSPAACPGVAGFSEADWQALDNIKAEELNPRFRRHRL